MFWVEEKGGYCLVWKGEANFGGEGEPILKIFLCSNDDFIDHSVRALLNLWLGKVKGTSLPNII